MAIVNPSIDERERDSSIRSSVLVAYKIMSSTQVLTIQHWRCCAVHVTAYRDADIIIITIKQRRVERE